MGTSVDKSDSYSAKFLIIGMVLAIALALAVYALWNGYWRTMASIIPGIRDTPSMSIAPIELMLLTRYKGIKPIAEDAPPLAWTLTMPRAYLKSEIGSAGSVYKYSTDCCDHFINLDAVYDPVSKVLSPAILASHEAWVQGAVVISLTNIGQLQEITSGNYCVRGDDFKAFMEQRGNHIDWRRACDPTAQLCRLHTHLDGWRIDLAVSRNFYKAPQDICAATLEFLNIKTTKRDDAR